MDDAMIAEFDAVEPLLETARHVRSRGYRRVRAYVPHAIPELEEVLAVRRTRIPVLVLGAALIGAASAYLVLWWCNAHDYPIDVGGRPLDSVPADVPIMFEAAVLFAALTAFVSMLLMSRMLRLHDPLTEIDGFERTSVDRFWLVLESGDLDDVDAELKKTFMSLGAVAVRRTRPVVTA